MCAAAGVTRGALRLYERAGLLPRPPRTASGYRQYDADTVARLIAIRNLKEIGFTLKEAALLLGERSAGRLRPARLRELARAQASAIDARIARLRAVRRYVVAVAEGDLSVLDDPECAFLVEFLSAEAAAAQTTENVKRKRKT